MINPLLTRQSVSTRVSLVPLAAAFLELGNP
jgi:hypothetical protein